MLAVHAENLGRTYEARGKGSPVRALSGVSLKIELGTVQGLLGPNGAGKTTLTKILSTALLPSEGRASVLGLDVVRQTAAVRREIGLVLGGDRGLYPRLTARDNLEYWSALYNVPRDISRRRIPDLLERLGLATVARVETFSRGMKQRLHLARGLVADARVLLLDEPTMGMDPLAAHDFRDLIRELRAAGKSILLTTHDMAEAEAVCDSVALIDHGRVLAVETPDQLAKLVARFERIDFTSHDQNLAERLRALDGISTVQALQSAADYRIELQDDSVTTKVLSFLLAEGVTSIRTSRPSLAEVYVHVIGDRGFDV